MKTKLLLLIAIIISNASFAQESIINDINDPLLKKYIDLAVKNFPRKKTFDATLEKAKAQVNIATLGVLDIFNAGYFYRPENQSGIAIVPGTGGNTNIVTRGFQAGVNINLGSLLSRPSMIKSAKADYKIAAAQSEEYNTTLTSEVKSRYYDLLSAKKQLELRTLAAKDLKSILGNAQTQFQNGTITIDVYTMAKNASVESDAAVLTSEVTYLKAKNALEDLIGTKIENVR